jgi:hypothetical protein
LTLLFSNYFKIHKINLAIILKDTLSLPQNSSKQARTSTELLRVVDSEENRTQLGLS